MFSSGVEAVTIGEQPTPSGEGLGVDADVKTTRYGVYRDRETISEAVAEDHARLLAMIRQCLAEIGITASLTTFHGLILRPESHHSPTRYEPELDVFRSEE